MAWPQEGMGSLLLAVLLLARQAQCVPAGSAMTPALPALVAPLRLCSRVLSVRGQARHRAWNCLTQGCASAAGRAQHRDCTPCTAAPALCALMGSAGRCPNTSLGPSPLRVQTPPWSYLMLIQLGTYFSYLSPLDSLICCPRPSLS